MTVLSLLVLSACETPGEVTNPGTPEECIFHPLTACDGFSFSIIDKDTYESLIGEDRLIHPDSIVITNTRGNEMHNIPKTYSDGWYTVEQFSPFDEITCFNQCLLDSAFSREYYIYLGNGDTDTLEVHFPVTSQYEETYYNGISGGDFGETPIEVGGAKSSFYFRKTL